MSGHPKFLGIRWVDWNEHNLDHIDKCAKKEVDEVLLETCASGRVRDQGWTNSEFRRRYEGETCGGRILFVIASPRPNDGARPVSCYRMGRTKRGKYIAWQNNIMHRWERR